MVSRNARPISWPTCIARYPDGTVIRLSVTSQDGLPPYDAGKRICDLAYASTVYRRRNNVSTAGHSICSLEFHDEAEFCRTFRVTGAVYEIVESGAPLAAAEPPPKPVMKQKPSRRHRLTMLVPTTCVE